MGKNRQGSAASKRSRSAEIAPHEFFKFADTVIFLVCLAVFTTANVFLYTKRTADLSSKPQIVLKENTNGLNPDVLNNADIHEYLKVKGVGTKRANSIMLYRELLGGFTNTEQLLEVKGIGEKTYTAIMLHFYGEEFIEKVKSVTENSGEQTKQ